MSKVTNSLILIAALVVGGCVANKPAEQVPVVDRSEPQGIRWHKKGHCQYFGEIVYKDETRNLFFPVPKQICSNSI
ncbi:MAG: hypothetical protein OQK12_16790 [Motiliproteus sp.]|nr:hypothetical protein [Motiliproteus sp.]MCW9051247.1 hypothetical protein [Motiliproteus sp.]